MPITFTEKQHAALKLLSNDVRHTLLRGGGRSGKTVLLMYAVITRALKAPRSRHLVARKAFQHCKQSLWFGTFETVIDLCYPELRDKIKDNKDLWFKEFPNGAQIWFGGLDDAARLDKILGNEYATILLNEVSEISWEAVGTVRTRLAQKVPELKNKIYYDMNPTSSNHWSYQIFFKGKMPDTGKSVNDTTEYQTMQMNPIDNLENIDSAYIKDLENASERKQKRFLYGEYADDVDIAVFREDKIKYFRKRPERVLGIMQSWDTAFKKDTHNDPSVCLTWLIGEEEVTGVTRTEKRIGYYLIDIFSKKMDYPELKAAVIGQARNFSPDEVLIEDAASGQSLIQDLLNNTTLNIIPCSPQRQDKVTRAMYASDFIDRGVVYFPMQHENVDEYKAQLMLFPFAENDDYVDATSQFFKYIKNNYEHGYSGTGGNGIDGVDEIGYIDAYSGGDGACPVTGY